MTPSPPLLFSDMKRRAGLRIRTSWKHSRTWRCGLQPVVHIRTSGFSSLSVCRNLQSLCIFVCFNMELIRLVVSAKNPVVILSLTRESEPVLRPD